MGQEPFLLDPKSKRFLGERRPVPRNVRNASAAAGALLFCLAVTGGCTAFVGGTLRGASREDLAIVGFMIGLPSALMTLACMALSWRKFNVDLPEAHKADLLEEHGQVLEGELLEAFSHKRRVPGFWVTERYRLESPRGRELFGENRCRRNDLKSRKLPAPGAPVAVLYLDDENFRLL